MKRGLRVWTRTIIGGLVVLLMVAVAGCAEAEPNSKGVARVPTSATSRDSFAFTYCYCTSVADACRRYGRRGRLRVP